MKNGRKYGTTEATEKYSVSSKRISVKSETPQDFRPFFPSLVPEGIRPEEQRAQRGGGKKFLNSLKINSFSVSSVFMF
jgi:hypothetical protein